MSWGVILMALVLAAIPAGFVAALALRNILRAVHDLDELSLLHAAVPEHARREHALVLGGGWAGLITAAVLSRYFRAVTLVERDPLLREWITRAGAPQTGQVHTVLDYAIAFARALYPDFDNALQASGGRIGERGQAWGFHQRGAWRMRQNARLPMYFVSRPRFEHVMRTLVLERTANLRVLDRTRVLALVAHSDARSVAGAQLTTLHDDGGEPFVVDADFVADCTGKSSRAVRWLADLGYGSVPEECVDSHIQYVTRDYSRGRGNAAQADFGLILHGAADAQGGARYAGALTVEDDTLSLWAVTAGAPAPRTDAELAAFFDALETPAFAEQWRSVEAAPQGPARVHGSGPMTRRHYAALSRFPDNFVVLGDGACTTNPVFGLGLSLAASGVASLNAALLQRAKKAPTGGPLSLRGLGRAFAQRLAWRTLGPWLITTAEDYRLPVTEGPRKSARLTRVLQAYNDRLFRLAHRDAMADVLLLRLAGLLSTPLSVLYPRMLWRVIRGA